MDKTVFAQIRTAVLTELSSRIQALDPNIVEELLREILDAERIFFAAAGRSRQMLSAFAMRVMHMGLCAHVVGDATTPAIGPGDLLLAASGSGETDTTLLLAGKAKQAGARLAVFTAQPASSLGQLADQVFPLLTAPQCQRPPQALQIGAAPFEESLLILGDILVILLAKELGIQDVNATLWKNHANLE